MSYSVISQCGCCEKNQTCTDAKAIQEAVQKIHSNTYEQGHQGCGNIVHQCYRAVANQYNK